MKNRLYPFVFALLAGSLLFWYVLASAEARENAGSFVVGCGASRVGDLISALMVANGAGMPSTVHLAANCTYALTAVHTQFSGPNALPVISGNVTVNGNNATITRAAGAPEMRFFYVDQGHLTLQSVTLRGGKTPLLGGAIHNDGVLLIQNSVVQANEADDGGGIYNEGSLQLWYSAIVSNTANFGGGLFNEFGTLTVSDSTIAHNDAANDGGGLFNEFSTATLTRVTLQHNAALDLGGGIFNDESQLFVESSTVAHNLAGSLGGGLYNDFEGALTVVDGVLSDNGAHEGGGLHNNGGATLAQTAVLTNQAHTHGGGLANGGTLTMTETTIDHNTAVSLGGGIYNQFGTMHLSASSLFHNHAMFGGGIYNKSSSLHLENVTVSQNQATTGSILLNENGSVQMVSVTAAQNIVTTPGAGVYNFSGDVSVFNTLIAHNAGGHDCQGAITSADYNLDSDDTCQFGRSHDLPQTNALLAPPVTTSNGTMSFPLQRGSPAFDGGNCHHAALVDQRGLTRPQGRACDIGAYEMEAVYFHFIPIVVIDAVVGGDVFSFAKVN